MTGYTETLTVTVPETLAEIAAKIGKAFDPDSGGEHSFHADGNGLLICRTPVKPFFKEQAFAMLQNAAYLHAACAQDYATRWPDLTPPTLAECEAFVAQVVLE